MKQSRSALDGLTETDGGVISCVIVVDAVASHPLASVVVSVKVPGELTSTKVVVAPVDQRYDVAADAFKASVVVTQFNTVLLEEIEAGAGVFTTIVIAEVAVQPLAFWAVTL